MKETQKNVRDYLAAIGKRGGTGQPARADQVARAANGRVPRDETRGFKGWQAVAAA